MEWNAVRDVKRATGKRLWLGAHWPGVPNQLGYSSTAQKKNDLYWDNGDKVTYDGWDGTEPGMGEVYVSFYEDGGWHDINDGVSDHRACCEYRIN